MPLEPLTLRDEPEVPPGVPAALVGLGLGARRPLPSELQPNEQQAAARLAALPAELDETEEMALGSAGA